MDDMRCPNHPKASVIVDARAGDVICTECGVVIGDRCAHTNVEVVCTKTCFCSMVDVGTEWRSFNNEKSVKDPSRVGAPENPLMTGGDLSTSIAVGFGDDYGWG